MEFLSLLQKNLDDGVIPEKIYTIMKRLYESYAHSITTSGLKMEEYDHHFETLLKLVQEQLDQPYHFEPFHQKVTAPFNYHTFGMDFLRPLMDEERTRIDHLENVDKIDKQMKAGENVILFANHQTEIDPQLMNMALENQYPELGSEIIFVAGDRVLSDPMAIPFSMGRNLLCIYSKRHIDNPPEKKHEKQQHNQRTMKRMKELLSEGGKCIYVAPSGGRDRPNQEGEVVVAPFDPQSIEMFRLMAKQAKHPTHFYPLSLATFDILPPPQSIEAELGEQRLAKREGALFSFGDEIDMDQFPGSELNDKQAKRSARAMYIWNLVKTNYATLKRNI